MLRTIKIFAIGSVGLIALLTAALFAVDLGFMRGPLNTQISHALGREFAIDGPLSIRIGTSIRIAATDIRLAANTSTDPGEAHEEAPTVISADNKAHTTANALAIKTLHINMPLSALLKQPIIIDDIRLRGVQLQTDANRAGTPPTTGTQPAQNNNASTRQGPEQRPEPLPVVVRHLQIDDLRWQHEDSARAAPLDLQIARIVQRLDGDAVVLDATGQINQTPTKLHVTGQPLHHLLQRKAAEFHLDGEFGEIRVSGSGRVNDLWQPEKPEVAFEISGPSLEYLTERLGIREISRGPLQLTINVAPLIDQMQFTINGQFGEFLLLSAGTFDSVQTLDNIALSVTASGPNSQRLGDLLGQGKLPAKPFNADITLTKTGRQLRIKDSQLTIGELQLRADGQIPDLRKPGHADIHASAELPNIALFADVLKLPAGFTGPITAQVSIHSEADDHPDSDTPASGRIPATFTANVISDYGRLLAQGQLSATHDLSGSRGQIKVNSDRPNLLLAAMGIDAPPIEPLTMQTELALDSGVLTLATGTLNLGNQAGNFEGQVAFGDSASDSDSNSAMANGPRAELAFSARGADLATTLRLQDAPTELYHSFALKTALNLTTRQLKVTDFSVALGGSTLAGTMDVDLTRSQIDVDLSGRSTNLLAWASSAQWQGTGEALPVDVTANAQWRDGLLTIKALEVKSPAITLDGAGTLRGLPHFGGSDIQLTLDVTDLSKFSPLLGRPLPSQPLRLVAAATGSPTALAVHTLALTSGASALTGSATISNPTRPHIQLALSADLLDLRPFQAPAPSEAVKPKRANTGDNRPTAAQPLAVDTHQKPTKRLIPDSPIDLTGLANFDADVDVSVNKLHFNHRHLSDITLSAQLADGELRVTKAAVTDEQEGHLLASASLRPDNGSHRLALRLRGEAINPGLFAQSEAQMAALPRYQIKLASIASGNTVRDMFAQSDGFIRIEGGRGRYPAGNIQLLTNSFIDELLSKLNPFAKREPYIDVNCAVAIAKLEQGELSGDPIFILNSKKLNIFASADIDFNSEKIGATFKTVPQKGLGLSVSNLVNPFIGVGGTLAQPYLTLNPQQTLISGGAAVATGGLSLLATSLADRFLSESDPCGAALKKADAEFSALAKKYAVDEPI